MTKILFINAIDISRPIERRYPPLGIGYICSFLRARFPGDAIEFRVVDRDVEREIAAFGPDIVGISAVTRNYARAAEYAGAAQAAGAVVLCGGVHISMLPGSLDPRMDAGVIGEGEETVCALYGAYRENGRLTQEKLRQIRGVAFRDESGAVVVTEPREQIMPLDTIPFPARDLFSVGKETYIFSSRGCPYACRFCASSRFWKKVRFFSAEYVVREIEYLRAAYGVTRINFYDDLFCADIGRLKKMIELLEQRGILGAVEFAGSVRADLVTGEMAALLKKMGFCAVGIGLESGCDRTLAFLKGENVGARTNADAVARITKHGMKAYGSFIIGSPSETAAEMLETLAFIKKSGLSGFDIYALTPFPGTPVWEYAKAKGLVSDTMDWSVLDVDFEKSHRTAVILSETLGRDELYRIYSAFKRYGKYLEWKNGVTGCARYWAHMPLTLLKKIVAAIKKDV